MSEQGRRQGRPPIADVDSLLAAALPLIERRGYEQISMAAIADELGLSVRTLHRYLPAKADIVWSGIDGSITALTQSLREANDGDALLDAIALAVGRVLRHNVEDLRVMRARIRLIARTPALRSARSTTFENWRDGLIRFVACRLGQPPTALAPIALGSAVHETISQALGWWSLTDDETDPTDCVRQALDSLAALSTNPPDLLRVQRLGHPE